MFARRVGYGLPAVGSPPPSPMRQRVRQQRTAMSPRILPSPLFTPMRRNLHKEVSRMQQKIKKLSKEVDLLRRLLMEQQKNTIAFQCQSLSLLEKKVKLVVFAPKTHSDIVRQTIGNAGAGAIGNYDHCSFTTQGVARFRAKGEAQPANGEANMMNSVNEEKIETICFRHNVQSIIDAVKKVHPYEEVGYDVYPLE